MFKGLFVQQGTAGDQLVSVLIKNRGLGCDPLLGLGRLEWTTAGDISLATIELYADTGSGYVVVTTGVDPTIGILNFDVSGQSGFTSLDATNFEIRLVDAGLVDLRGSPKYLSPTYPCL